jgi:hypothetical protein
VSAGPLTAPRYSAVMLPETEAESARRMRSACAADAKPAAPVNQSGEQIGKGAVAFGIAKNRVRARMPISWSSAPTNNSTWPIGPSTRPSAQVGIGLPWERRPPDDVSGRKWSSSSKHPMFLCAGDARGDGPQKLEQAVEG